MCDYSLTCVPNRLAIEGEELVVRRFYAGSRGLASPADLPAQPARFWPGIKAALRRDAIPAVCIPPGAELRLTGIADEVRRSCGVGEVERVRFIARSCNEYEHRDAIRFSNGKELPLQFLPDGQRATVLALESGRTDGRSLPSVSSYVSTPSAAL